MGCVCRPPSFKMECSNIIKSSQIKSVHTKRPSFSSVIPKKDWMNIIDYLNYQEVKEVGKLNK